jgi:type II secretory pathway component PulM
MMATSLRRFRAPAPLASWLATKSRAERRIATTLLLLVGIALLWAALWQPLLRDTAALRLAQAGNAAALADARKMAREIGGLARPPAMEAPSDVRAGLDRILVTQNLRPAVTQLEWRDGRAYVVLAAVDYDALIVALEAMQRDARLRAVEARLTARVEPGMVRAELTLAR